MKKNTKDEKLFLRKGYIIKKVEKKPSLNYIDKFIKTKLINLINLSKKI